MQIRRLSSPVFVYFDELSAGILSYDCLRKRRLERSGAFDERLRSGKLLQPLRPYVLASQWKATTEYANVHAPNRIRPHVAAWAPDKNDELIPLLLAGRLGSESLSSNHERWASHFRGSGMPRNGPLKIATRHPHSFHNYPPYGVPLKTYRTTFVTAVLWKLGTPASRPQTRTSTDRSTHCGDVSLPGTSTWTRIRSTWQG
ncbi:MAG: hypothetical protein JWO49_863 [Arthrobacter sp.]|nr:hypothetical protein [Arthrobacter sp.]